MTQPRSLAEAFTTELAFAKGAVPIRLRVSGRAQRVALRIDGHGQAVELVLPRRTSLVSGLKFLDQNRDWVEARLKDLPVRVPFADGSVIPILGTKYRIRHMKRRPGDQGPVWIEGDEIRVTGESVHIARRVRDFLLETARREFTRRARAFGQQVDRKVGRISIRDMTSRWGSCSSSGSLAFSWRLIFAPEGVVTYIVAHEVCHLVAMNHGPRFWRLVESLVPDARFRQDWLRRHRTSLMRFG